jgi:hypothetical protein
MRGTLVCNQVEAPITIHLRDFASNLEKYKVVQKAFRCKKIEIRKTTLCGLFSRYFEIIMHFQSQKWA